MGKQKGSPRTVAKQLARIFDERGYVRRPNADRVADEPLTYKKGWEVRLVVDTHKELQELRALLKMVGFNLSKPHRATNRWRQPIYGKAEVERFLKMIGRDK